ncbi:SpoIID/LytB domain-containing protein [Patescibacteria group bacterium]|nr:SpoIID/LytB domain-containing protein [Patescibacteria group bacterium]
MKKLFVLLLVVVGLILGVGFVTSLARADELDDITKQINELSKAREMSVAATKPLEAELGNLNKKLDVAEAGINKAKEELRGLEASIDKRERDFSEQYVLLAERALSFYKSSRAPSSLFVLFSNGGLARDLFYSRVVTDRDKDEIAMITEDLIQLSRDKKKAEEDRVRLADLQVKLDKEADFFRGEIAGAKTYQAELSSQIASLSAKQQSIISQRQASLNLPVSLGAGTMMCTDDRKLDPGFGGALAFYTYGIPHRVGMNQYGAYGRAKAGQDYKEILNAYFDGISFEGGKQDIKIKIQGHGEKSLDEYLLGIYEMPESWDMNALKAQAVAARSYALSYTNNGANEICTTQACQVWKSDPKTGQWKQAVEQTKGEVMVNGGQVIKAWYSSTDGGYTFTSGDIWGGDKPWTKRLRDTNGDVGSFSELNEKSYDKDSPCFYAAQGWRGEYANSAWLKPSEVADIVNVLMLAKADSGTGDHLYQTDKPHPYGGEIWNEEKVKSELSSKGITPFNSVSGVSVGADFGSGKTTSVNVSGDAGSKSFSGDEFKSYFNIRAPANIQIVGPLYNVERK